MLSRIKVIRRTKSQGMLPSREKMCLRMTLPLSASNGGIYSNQPLEMVLPPLEGGCSPQKESTPPENPSIDPLFS